MKHWLMTGMLVGALAAPGLAMAQTPRAPKQQPTTAPAADVSVQAMTLGTVRIPRAVKADGKPLPAGTYQLRLTTDEAQPDAVGTSGRLERWVEFVQKGQVKGREVATIVPQGETDMVVQDAPPRPGRAKVQMLKGGDYLRVWINRGGNRYRLPLVVWLWGRSTNRPYTAITSNCS